MQIFTSLFLAAILLGIVIELWLLGRHQRNIQTHRDKVPTAFSEKVSLQEHRKAADYSGTKISLGRIELIFGTALLLLWTLGGGIEWLASSWRGLDLAPLPRGIGLILSFFLINGIISLPFTIYRTFVIEVRYGFNRTTPAQFIKDLLLQTLLSLLLGVPVLWAILWLMDSAGSYWWLAAWAVWIGFMFFVTWIYPTVIAPLFNKFTPLEQGPLLERIESLLERCGFSSKGIFVMDGSKRSGHGNAYFTGFGKNKRIVFFDTLIESLSPEETEAVLAHELGHFKRKHITKRLLFSVFAALAGMWLLGWVSDKSWFFLGLGVSEGSNALALLLFMLAVPVFTQFVTPAGAWISRKHEFEADDFAAETTNAEHLITALVKMYRENASTLTPDALYSAFHDSHPPAPVRIAHLSSRMAASRSEGEITP
jgi:STE24 endopeptidase